MSKTYYCTKCEQRHVKTGAIGKKPAWVSFDEPDLDVVDEGVTARYAHLQAPQQKRNGGPREVAAQREG